MPSGVWIPTAAIVVEILSPEDETWEKFGFYARHGVEEICVVDTLAPRIRWFERRGDIYEETGASTLLGVAAKDLEARIDWPR